MAGRCGCEGTSCSCLITAGTGVAVSGSGSTSQPYQISADAGKLGVVDTATVNLTLTGTGQAASPYSLKGDATVRVADLTDVDHTAAPTNGQVLSWNGTKWIPAPAVTATPGAVRVTGCLIGDGSVPTPLNVKVDPAGGLVCTTPGLGVNPSLLAFQAGLTMQPWTHAWRNDVGVAVVPGSGPMIAEYARWGKLCFVNFQWQGGSGFVAQRGPWNWSAPFPAKGPAYSVLQAYCRTTNGVWWDAIANISPGGTLLRMAACPADNQTHMEFVQSAIGTGSVINGTGVPYVASSVSFKPEGNSLLSICGWYRVDDGA
jgi:hypothetical protein